MCELCGAPATPRARGARALCRVCFEHDSPEPTRAEERACFPNLTGSFDEPPCDICGGGADEGLVMLCDGPCDRPFHAHCVDFQGPVEGDWLCADCRRQNPKATTRKKGKEADSRGNQLVQRNNAELAIAQRKGRG